MVLAAVGKNGTGKDFFLEYVAKTYGFPMISIGDVVRELATADGLELTRDNLHATSKKYMTANGQTFFPELIVKKIKESDSPNFLVSGIRPPSDIEIFKNQGPIKEATLVPLVFPLLAGAGAFTTLLSLRSEYAPVNIVVALILNMVWVYVVLKLTDRIERFLGKGGIYVIRKFFGIILLAISARLFTANLTLLIEQFQKAQ